MKKFSLVAATLIAGVVLNVNAATVALLKQILRGISFMPIMTF